MKKTIVTLAFFTLVCLSNSAKEASLIVPVAVKKAFTADFPKALNVKWGLEKPGEFEAEFKVGNAELAANFDAKGSLLVTETATTLSQLPVTVKSSLSKGFAGFKISEAEKADVKGVITYEMQAKKEKAEFVLVFDQSGKLLKKESVKEEKNEKED